MNDRHRELVDAACAQRLRSYSPYSHFRVVLEVFRCQAPAGRVRRNGPIDHRWVQPGELAAFPLPAATHKAIALLGPLERR